VGKPDADVKTREQWCNERVPWYVEFLKVRAGLACITVTVPHADPSLYRPRHSALSAGLSA